MLSAAVPDDQHWDNQFGPPGVNGSAYGIAVIGKNLYTAGNFTAAGNTKANAVAGFDGTNWFQLNSGLLGGPVAICCVSDNNNLYVGGIFTNADDPSAIDTARWDGTNWSGIGIQGVTFAVKRNGANLYFAGSFNSAGGVAATNIARWDGTNWFALGPGVSGPNVFPNTPGLDCVALQGNNVYVGGYFSYAGALSMTNVGYWDGSVWHAMGNPFNGTVDALQFYGGYLYAGGSFTNSTLHFTNFARWDGSTWSAAPGGGANKQVSDMATDGANLFVGGLFTQIGGIAATGIVSFNGTTWTNFGGVFNFQGGPGQVNRMLCQSSQLYISGGFERAGNTGADNIARWDGTNWWSIGGMTSQGVAYGVNYMLSLLSVNGPSLIPAGLYAGGLSTEAGDAVINGIGRWDGTIWNAVGGGVSGNFTGNNGQRVLALATDGAYLYAGGIFTNAGGNYASGVACWDGSSWAAMDSGVDWIVNALAVDNANYVYVGGSFTNAGGVYSKGLAVWVYGSWNNLGNVEGTNATVSALAYDGNAFIYAGGTFYTAGGVAATNIACFNNGDFTWHPVGAGLTGGSVYALANGNGMLYAGGSFTNAGGLIVNRIAQWNGSSWSALGSGITGNSAAKVLSIAVAGTNVYVTGLFTNAGGINVSNIARWNGSSWSAMGSGLDPARSGNALAVVGNDIYASGNFSFAGDKPSQFIAHWNSQSNYYPAANIQLTRAAWLTNRLFRFRVNGTYGQSYVIQGSTNFSTWLPLQTNSAMFYDFSDVNSSGYPGRFYRAVLGP